MIQYKPWSMDVVQTMAQKACEGVFTCLDIEVGDKCPYNCVYCESPSQNRVSKLDVDKVCLLLRTKQFKWVYICGIGEPTFDSNEHQLLQILECCKQNDAKCSIFTNLSNLSDTLAEYIKDDVLYCVFKFDSQSANIISELYNPFNIQEHLENIEKIVNLVRCDGKTTNIAASIVPTKYNINEIPDLTHWCLERDIFPLIAQLEYTGAAKQVYEKLVVDDDALINLNENISQIIGEKYRVPFCPAIFAGFSITYDNKIVVDRRTGLSCHSFWLDDPDLDVVCDDFSSLMTLDDITKRIIDARIERYDNFVMSRKLYQYDILGGCGGNRKDVFELYDKMMKACYCTETENNYNLKINRFVYMDNNATTQISNSVRKVMEPYLGKYFTNPNSNSHVGRNIRAAVDKARRQVAKALNCTSSEIYFTSCGSESNSWAVKSCLNDEERIGKHIILSTEIEHESVIDCLASLDKDIYEVIHLPITKNGDIDIDCFLKKFMRWDEVAFASVMLVNNETGVINDVKRLTAILHNYNIPIHCDAVQGLGKMVIDVRDLGVDYLSISGHKIHAPKGIGAMYAKKGRHMCPLIYGSQESRLRGGTENVAYIVALGQAVEDIYFDESAFEEEIRRITEYRDLIEEKFLYSPYKAVINGKNAKRVSNTINIGFLGIDALKLALLLEGRGLYVSNGSACNIVNPQESHVLKAMHSPVEKEGAIRISFSKYTQERDINYLIDNLREAVKKMKGE